MKTTEEQCSKDSTGEREQKQKMLKLERILCGPWSEWCTDLQEKTGETGSIEGDEQQKGRQWACASTRV